MRNQNQRPANWQHQPAQSHQGQNHPAPVNTNQQFNQQRNAHQNANAGNPQASNRSVPAQNDERSFGQKFVAYGGKAAFQLGDSKTKDGKHTIMIESANKLNPNDRNDRKLDWNNKVCFQLTINELPIFIAVMYGFLSAARFDSHGACNSKFLDVFNQGDKFFFKSGAKDVALKVAPVSVTEATHFGMMALGAYAQNFPGISSESVMSGLKVLIKRLCDTNAITQPQQQR